MFDMGHPALTRIPSPVLKRTKRRRPDLTRDKLMEIPAFVWCYDKVMVFHHFADRLLAPYKEAAMRELRAWRQWLRDYRAWLKGAPAE